MLNVQAVCDIMGLCSPISLVPRTLIISCTNKLQWARRGVAPLPELPRGGRPVSLPCRIILGRPQFCGVKISPAFVTPMRIVETAGLGTAAARLLHIQSGCSLLITESRYPDSMYTNH
jgi:energy-converting hydrogenase Eha subunit F